MNGEEPLPEPPAPFGEKPPNAAFKVDVAVETPSKLLSVAESLVAVLGLKGTTSSVVV